jgi:hypothetical protein
MDRPFQRGDSVRLTAIGDEVREGLVVRVSTDGRALLVMFDCAGYVGLMPLREEGGKFVELITHRAVGLELDPAAAAPI